MDSPATAPPPLRATVSPSPPVRLLSASNPVDGVIVARFSRAMRQDAALTSLRSWNCIATSSLSLPIALTAVVAGAAAYPETVVLRYEGGGFECTLAVTGVASADGSLLDPAFSSLVLPILRPGDVEPTVRLFDTIWGPLGMSQRASLRRTVDQLVANRALANAVNLQLQQRLASGDGTSGRDGRPGAART